MQTQRPTVALIRRSAVRHNYLRAAELSGGREVIAVVKADAYGHGSVPVAETLVASGCRRLAVVTVEEAVQLREAGIEAAVLVLGGAESGAEAEECIARELVPVVHHEGHAELLATRAAARGERARVQVEVDTGMRRMGVPPDAAPALLEKWSADGALAVEGVYSHLARADEPDLSPSLEQAERFRAVLDDLRRRGVDPGEVHLANSAGLLAGEALARALPEATAVRPGLMLYGAQPASHLGFDRRPVMTLRSAVANVRRVRAGDAVGYAGLFRALRDTHIATLPVGYADGVPISASNSARVLLAGRSVPVVGRVSMDFITVDAGEAGARIGDEVVLFGDPEGALPVEEAAAAAGTLAYELLVRVGPRVPRRVVD